MIISSFVPKGEYMYILEPEVAGQIGECSAMDSTCHPPEVSELTYIFYGWLGDALLESFPCYIVTESLASELENSTLTGFELASLTVGKSEEFLELHPQITLPNFKWLKVIGGDEDDFSLDAEFRLVVSNQCFELLNRFNIQNCDVVES
jgi:hypothetical protein